MGVPSLNPASRTFLIPPPPLSLSPTSLPVSSKLSNHNEGKKKKCCILNLTGHHFCGSSHRLKAVEGRWSPVSVFYLHCEATISLHPSLGPSPVRAPSLCPGLDHAPSLFLALSLDCSKVCEESSGLLDHDCDLFDENKGWIRGYYKKHMKWLKSN